MQFLTAVEKLYPHKYIRTRQIDKLMLYNSADINDLFNTSLIFDDEVSLYNHYINYDKEEKYITQYKLDELLNTIDNTIVKNILKEMNVPTILTKQVLIDQVKTLFDEVFIYDVNVNDYHIDMYMLKYNIAIELPDSKNDPILREKFCKKTRTKCIQLHNESTFNGNVVEANKDFCNAMSVIIKNMI